MANQDYLTIDRADPSAGYARISGGWERTVASGLAKMLPASTGCLASTAVADTDEVAYTSSFDADVSTTGFTVTTNDTYDIQDVPAQVTTDTSVDTSQVSIVVTENGSGSFGNGTFTLADSEISSISNVGKIVFDGSGGIDQTDGVMAITYYADKDEEVQTFYSAAIPVTGFTTVKLRAPASPHAEVTGCWEYTKDTENADGTWGGWSVFYALQAGEYTVQQHELANGALFIRFKVESKDINMDGVVESNATYAHIDSGAYAELQLKNDDSLNDALVSIGGLGVDPS